MNKAIVLGANPDGGNIGSVTASLMLNEGWDVESHDCYVPAKKCFDVPHELDFVSADALIVSLGATVMHDFNQVTSEQIERVINACLTLPIQCANEYVAERGRSGKIIFIGSYAHRHPFNSGTAYCAAKAGLDMATKTIAWETTDLGFRTYCIHPYHVPGTPMWEKVQENVMANKGMTREEADEYALKDAKMPLLSACEVAETVMMLLDNRAMNWASGSSIELFGGTR